MDKVPLTIWQTARAGGCTRRDFLKYCGALSAALGLSAGQARALVQAMDTKPRPPVLWYHFQECTCCSESFIRSSHPIVADVVLDVRQIEVALRKLRAFNREGAEVELDIEGTIDARRDASTTRLGSR